MKFFLLALFVAVASSSPDDASGPIELIVNGLQEGQPLEISDVVGIKLNEHNDGVVLATDVLHPLSAAGIAEAIAAEIAANPEPVALPAPAQPELIESVPEAVVLPAPAQPEIVPEAVILPAPAQPEVLPVILPATVPGVADAPEAIVLPAPAVPEVIIPEAVVLPSPAQPEVVPEIVALPETPEVQPVPAATAGEIFNNGDVQVQVNVNGQETGYLSTIQGWFSMVLNYFNDGAQTTQQIV